MATNVHIPDGGRCVTREYDDSLEWEERTRQLAVALVDFDPVLALEVREHVNAKADGWDERDKLRSRSPGRKKHIHRYRTLARLIDSLTSVRLESHS